MSRRASAAAGSSAIVAAILAALLPDAFGQGLFAGLACAGAVMAFAFAWRALRE